MKLGVLSQKRRDAMVNGRFDHDIVLHEAGVPPIHTPLSVFKELSPEVSLLYPPQPSYQSQQKERVYLYHIAHKDLPPDLKGAKTGIENTLVLDVKENKLLAAYKKLDIISSIDIFQNLPLRKVRDLLESSKVEKVKAGELVIKEGEKGEKFYIIAEGIVRAFSEKIGYEKIPKTAVAHLALR